MAHKEVRQLIQKSVEAISDDITFLYATDDDFNSSIANKKTPLCRLELLKSSSKFIHNSVVTMYQPEVVFYMQDDIQGNETETLKILDQVDDYVQTFIRLMNKISITPDDTDLVSTDTTVISNVRVQPFKKATSDCLTGFIITFDLDVPDDFDYCLIYPQ